MTFVIGHHAERTKDDSSQQVIMSRIESIISSTEPKDWNTINCLLGQLKVSTAEESKCSIEDDPMGRLIIGKVLSRNPPVSSLKAALRAFPDSLNHNPAAFSIACHHASSKIIAEMTRHTMTNSWCFKEEEEDCPYPWIVSNLITVEGLQAILEVYPHGVLQKSSLLSNLSPLDYFLKSTDMIEKRNVDAALWSKFKLLLVAAEYSESSKPVKECCPVHILLKRILSYQGFFDNQQGAQHALWLLYQLYSTDMWVFEKPNEDGIYPLQFALSHKCKACSHFGLMAARELIKILLQAHPQSARYLVHERLTIHMAVENGWPCHDLLLAVFPEALDAPDSKTKLLPFQTAAAAGLDITFELLRANPSQIMCLQNKVTGVRAQA